ncbi:DUF2480 family protein [Acidiluteibacter ferrifornacis]|uniref:DUF2480 family protein n=1 Tax=Acidiluteibacter ferrifornacis TaxID=2692424 RepID=A0A6N9NQ39_9FLAO|nr:DUF2480 family protein [Acidiluteibacter ferrifornacis]NBG67217.1 DUF2480 family protein [Acidiluteibacter ferrifornacis]
MAEEIINRVAKSGIITLNLEDYYVDGERVAYDIKQNLWQEIALKEKDFREFIKTNDWSVYKDKLVAIHCSVDAIIPTWAYMLLSIALQPHAKRVFFGSVEYMNQVLYEEQLNQIDFSQYKDVRIVIKGCGDKAVPESAYVSLTNKLLPFAKAIMYGEPCSTVPLYKKPRI